MRSLSSLSWAERKGEFWRSDFKTCTSNIIEWMLSLWVRFWVQYSLLLQYGMLEKHTPIKFWQIFQVPLSSFLAWSSTSTLIDDSEIFDAPRKELPLPELTKSHVEVFARFKVISAKNNSFLHFEGLGPRRWN